ncbi:MAG: FGGY family carbohydrate kinase [Marmoricola sp.]
MSAIAVDAGTSLIKSVLYDADGVERRVARRHTRICRPREGWAEQDMAELWRTVASTIREVAGHAVTPVQFLAVTAQGDGCWLVDTEGEPTGPAILWSDGRASPVVESWARAGVADEAFRIGGFLSFSGLPNAILTWLGRHDPERLRRSSSALYCGGWLHLRLTGYVAVDESDAAAPYMESASRRYSARLHELFGTTDLARLLPPVRADNARVSPLSPDAATELGLADGLPVVMAPYDVVAMSIGTGTTTPGQSCAILGTTICTQVVQSEPANSGSPSGLTLPLGSGTRVLRAFATLSGAEVLQWARQLLGVNDMDDLGAIAATADVGAGGLVFLPYLAPAGERAPFLDARARGALSGIGLQHGRPEIARAVLEGLCEVVNDCLCATGSSVSQMYCCGGGSRSDLWCQLIADVTGVLVRRPADMEVGARGAFLTGLVATGQETDLESAAADNVREGGVFAPTPEHSAYYRDHYARFTRLRETLRPTWADGGVWSARP